MPKYNELSLKKQVKKYKDLGYPPNNGLWAGGILMRRHTESIKNLGTEWFFENTYFSVQDQVSLPFLLWKLKISCNPLPEKLWGGPLTFVYHKKEEHFPLHKRLLSKIKRITTLL